MTTLTAPAGRARHDVRRPPAFAQLLRTELRLFIREPVALFWGVAFPVVLLVVLGIATSSKPQHSLGNVKFIVARSSPTVLSSTVKPSRQSAYPSFTQRIKPIGWGKPSTQVQTLGSVHSPGMGPSRATSKRV